MSMFWILSILVIFIAAFFIIKLSLNTSENPDSNLGILKHPSTFKKQDVEYVDKQLSSNKEKDNG